MPTQTKPKKPRKIRTVAVKLSDRHRDVILGELMELQPDTSEWLAAAKDLEKALSLCASRYASLTEVPFTSHMTAEIKAIRKSARQLVDLIKPDARTKETFVRLLIFHGTDLDSLLDHVDGLAFACELAVGALTRGKRGTGGELRSAQRKKLEFFDRFLKNAFRKAAPNAEDGDLDEFLGICRRYIRDPTLGNEYG